MLNLRQLGICPWCMHSSIAISEETEASACTSELISPDMEEYCYCAEQQLCRLRQNVASSSSAAAMAGALEGVARVYEHVGSLVRLACCADQVEEELEESVALLDACAAARDSLRAMRACALDLEVAVRRGDGAGAQSAATAYARLSRKARADAKKQQRRLSTTRRGRRAAGEDNDDAGHSLQEARRVAVDVLERVVTALSRRVAAPGPSRWSTCVSRAFRNRTRVACEDAEEITAASPAFVHLCGSSSKDLHDGETASRVQKQLRTLADTIQRLEDGLELLFRRLVQCRVFLLNMCSS